MLDDEERTVLEETERALALNDPQLVRRMRQGWGRRGGRGRRVAVVVVTLVLVVGLFWLALPGHALLVLMLGLGFLLALGWRPPGRMAALLSRLDDPRR